MVQYQPIYTYQHAPRRNQGILRLVALLCFVAVSSIVFLSFTDYISWRQTQPQPFLYFEANTSPTAQANSTANMTAPLTLDEYLIQAKQDALEHLKAGSSAKGKLTIIMGNEAGDLDSAACAIGLSYLLSRFGPPSGYNLDKSSYVPLIQSEHADAVLRPENTAAFRASGIDPNHLFFLDDIKLPLDSDAFAPSNKVAIGLVDHPSLTGPWGGGKAEGREVNIVIDHHEDNADHQEAGLRIVKSPSKDPVGSCASLVAKLYEEQFKQGGDDVGLRQVSDLLISAIVIDTDNLRAAPRGKATKMDFEAVNTLFPASSFGTPASSEEVKETALTFSPLNNTLGAKVEAIQPLDPASDESLDSATQSAKIILAPYWSVLSQSKQAVSHLSGRDLLRRDYKEVDFNESNIALKLGFASVPVSIAEWLHKDRPPLAQSADPKGEVKDAWSAFWGTLDSFMEERKIDLAVMTGSFRLAEGEVDAGKHKRELVLAFAPRTLPSTQAERLWEELRKGLESDAHVGREETERRLMLEEPWKGQRMPEGAGGKKERVKGVTEEGRREGEEGRRWGKVYKQANARANRKVVLPAVMTVLKGAVRKL